MPPEDGPEDWRPGCPDCAELREELATLRAEMRAAVVAYEAELRGQTERHEALIAGLYAVIGEAGDPMDVYGPPDDTDMTSAEFQATRPKIAPED